VFDFHSVHFSETKVFCNIQDYEVLCDRTLYLYWDLDLLYLYLSMYWYWYLHLHLLYLYLMT